MYDPVVGRFLQEDPEGFEPGDPNLFRYVGNSPTNYTDPSGLTPIPDGVGAVIGAAGEGVFTGAAQAPEQETPSFSLQAETAIPTGPSFWTPTAWVPVPPGLPFPASAALPSLAFTPGLSPTTGDFLWGVVWKLSGVPKGETIQKGTVVQFVRIHFDLKKVSKTNPKDVKPITDLELFFDPNRPKAQPHIGNPGRYMEIWPILGIDANGICITPETTVFNRAASDRAKDRGLAIGLGASFHDQFAFVTELPRLEDKFHIVGKVGIEGFAVYVNNNLPKWDGKDPLQIKQLGQILLFRNPLWTGAGALLSSRILEPGKMTGMWNDTFKRPAINLKRAYTGGVYRKIVIEIDTRKNPAANVSYQQQHAIDRSEIESFLAVMERDGTMRQVSDPTTSVFIQWLAGKVAMATAQGVGSAVKKP